jgi:hypothetical protein
MEIRIVAFWIVLQSHTAGNAGVNVTSSSICFNRLPMEAAPEKIFHPNF